MINRIKNLSINWQIIISFLLLLGLFIQLGSSSFLALEESVDGIKKYEKMSNITNTASSVESNMLMVRMNVKDYLIREESKDVDEFNQYYDATMKDIKDILAKLEDKNRSKMVKEQIETKLKDYNLAFSQIIEITNSKNKIINETLNVYGKKMEQELTKVLNSSSKDNKIETAFHAGVALRDLLLARLYVMKYVSTNNESDKSKVLSEFKSFEAGLIGLSKEIKNAERKTSLESIKNYLPLYQAGFNEVVKSFEQRHTIVEGQLDLIGPQIAHDTHSLKLEIESELAKIGPELVEANKGVEKNIIFSTAFSALMSVLLIWLLITKVKSLVGKIVTDLSTRMQAIFGVSSALSTDSEQLAAGASEQAAAAQETVASVTEMNSMLSRTSDQVGESKTVINEINDKVSNGTKIMNSMVGSMDSIKSANQQLQDIVSVIDEIASKTVVINDIVFKTQLLSFNASIEAARAGQHGRGFAVVAEEIGSLALNSGSAATEIEGLIQKSKTQVNDIVKDTTDKVEEGQSVTTQAMDTFTEISSDLSRIETKIESIGSATTEQEQGIEQVLAAMTQMDEATKQTSELATKATDNSGNLKAESDKLGELLVGIKRDILGDRNLQDASKKSTKPSLKKMAMEKITTKNLTSAKVKLADVDLSDEIDGSDESFQKIS